MNKGILCGCGYGVATHPFEGLEGLRVHVLGMGSCCRRIAIGNEIPTNFRMELWTSYKGTPHEKTSLMEVCEVEGQTLTVWGIKNQRGYNYNDEYGIWSLPKKKGSINSLPDET